MTIISQIGDGKFHSIKCVSAEHPKRGRGGPPLKASLSVRANPDGTWILKCWSRGCSYSSIAAGLGVALPSRSRRKNNNDRWVVAAYEGGDGESFRSYRREFPRDFPETPAVCVWRDCGRRDEHKHVWVEPGARVKGSKPLLWGADDPANTILLVEGEAAAFALMRHFAAGSEPAGWTPATSAGGARSAKRIDWSSFAGRQVAIWNDNDAEGRAYLAEASSKIAVVGVAGLFNFAAVDGLAEKADAADLTAEEIEKVLKSQQAYIARVNAIAAENVKASAALPTTLAERIAPNANNADYRTLCVRLIARHGENLVIGDTSYRSMEVRHELYRALSTGRMANLRISEQSLMREVQRGYHADFVDVLQNGALGSGELGVIGSHMRRIADGATLNQIREQIAAAAVEFDDEGWEKPSGFRVVANSEVDDNGRYLGAPNGVIDLQTGLLLNPTEGLKTLTSLSVRDEFNPKAETELVEALTGHLSDEEREWLWSAIGATLWGEPDGNAYWLIGEGKGGKSTLIDSFKRALGDYGATLPMGVLASGRASGASPDVVQMVSGVRMWGASEIDLTNVSFHIFKTLAGGDDQNPRDLFKGHIHKDARVMGTMWMSLNSEAMPKLPMNDSGFERRFSALNYPLPSKTIPEMKRRLRDDKVERQALVAKMVRYAIKNPEHPEDCPTVKSFIAVVKSDSFDDMGRWIDRNLTVDLEEDGDGKRFRLTTAEVWDAAFIAAGEDNAVSGDGSRIWGQTRSKLVNAVKQMLGLVGGKLEKVRGADGKTSSGWYGIRWRTADEIEDYDAKAEGRTPVKRCSPTDWIAGGVACKVHDCAVVDGVCAGAPTTEIRNGAFDGLSTNEAGAKRGTVPRVSV